MKHESGKVTMPLNHFEELVNDLNLLRSQKETYEAKMETMEKLLIDILADKSDYGTYVYALKSYPYKEAMSITGMTVEDLIAMKEEEEE